MKPLYAMLTSLFRLLVRLYEGLWMLLITALLGAAALAMWHFYQHERLDNLVKAEGQPITVRVERADRKPREIWDEFRNPTYIGFTYHNRPYETRYVNDTLWVSEGDRVPLLYHPPSDAFRQPQSALTATPTRVVSRLISWSVVGGFTRENQLLGGFIVVVLALFFFGSGVVVTLTGLTVVQTIARFVLAATLGAGTLFFTYDAIHYFRYVNELRSNGHPMEVAAVNAVRTSRGRSGSGHSRKSHSHSYAWYAYRATFRFNRQERVVVVDEADYDRIKSGNPRLMVLYNPGLNDFIVEDYSPDYSPCILPLFFGFLFGSLLRSRTTRKTSQATAQ